MAAGEAAGVADATDGRAVPTTSAPTTTTTPPVPTTRRERQRQATFSEIVQVSRRLLATTGDLSLRAVAAEMGMTPPALYRYVDSYAELLLVVVRAVFDDVIAQMATARDRHPDDPAAQIVAAATAFRTWALGNKAEFRLVFASPRPDLDEVDGESLATRTGPPRIESFAACPPNDGSDAFSAFFSELFAQVWARYRFHVPTEDELDPEVLEVLSRSPLPEATIDGFGPVTPGLVWMFERAWAALYGTVALEVFGCLPEEFVTSGVLYTDTMRGVGRGLGLEPEWERLRSVARAAEPA